MNREINKDELTVHSNAETPLPKGFEASAFSAEIKKKEKDMAILYSDRPCEAAGVFTQNRVKADCVHYDIDHLSGGRKVRAILANSGNANACTGMQGKEDNRRLAEKAAERLSVRPDEVLLSSTGVIGVPLPIDRMLDTLESGERLSGLPAAAEAIMTTDTHKKIAGTVLTLGGKEVRVTGIAKGSGMIHPNMATMLSFITTDADISRTALEEASRKSAETSFNMISVDGDTSTNDMLLVTANGASENPRIDSLESEEGALFLRALSLVSRELAVMIARDGEGATKLIEVQVRGAAGSDEAKTLARAVTRSNLVKAAFYGEDANWGRILAALGATGADFDPAGVAIGFRSSAGDISLMKDGAPVRFDEEKAARILGEKEIEVKIGLSDGTGEALAWGCDLSHEYVEINGAYRT